MARFIERLAIECVEEREWLMMAVMNIGAILEYGKAGGMVRRFGGLGAKEGANAAGGALQAQVEITMMRVMAKKAAAGSHPGGRNSVRRGTPTSIQLFPPTHLRHAIFRTQKAIEKAAVSTLNPSDRHLNIAGEECEELAQVPSSVHEGVLKENFLEWRRRGMRKRRRTPLTTRKRTATTVWTFRMVTRT